jgi:WD40 repeat protein
MDRDENAIVTFVKKKVLRFPSIMVAFKFAPNSKNFVHASEEEVTIRDIESLAIKMQFCPSSGNILSCSFSSNSRLLAIGTVKVPYEVRDILSGAIVHSRASKEKGERGAGCVLCSNMLDDHSILLLASIHQFRYSSQVQVRNLNTGVLKQTFSDDQMNVLAFSPDGKYVCVGGNCVKVKTVFGGILILTVEYAGERVNALAFSPDSSLIAFGGTTSLLSGMSEHPVQVYCLNSRQFVFELKARSPIAGEPFRSA